MCRKRWRRYCPRRISDDAGRGASGTGSSHRDDHGRAECRARRIALGQCIGAGDGDAQGLLDILSSDYVPSSLLIGTFDLVDKAGWSLPQAMGTISSAPAGCRADGSRRDRLGLRADFVRVAFADGLPIPRATYLEGLRVS